MSISLDIGFWGWDAQNAGMPMHISVTAVPLLNLKNGEQWRERCSQIQVPAILSQRPQLGSTYLDPNQREVGLQQLLQQQTQPRPQGPLVFQYDGGKVPHIGKLEDLRDEVDGNHQSRRSLEPNSSLIAAIVANI